MLLLLLLAVYVQHAVQLWNPRSFIVIVVRLAVQLRNRRSFIVLLIFFSLFDPALFADSSSLLNKQGEIAGNHRLINWNEAQQR